MMIKFSGSLTVKRIENLRFKKDVVQQGCKRESLAGGRYNRTRVSQKSYYDQPKRSDFRKKENLINQIHKNWDIFQHVF